jgi:lysozyme
VKINARGLDIIKKYEGLRLKAYKCPAGRLTIGYGHTGDVKKGMEITEHQADVILDLDVERFEREVEELFPGANEDEFSALVSLAFNVGTTRLEDSKLRVAFLAGDKWMAANQFLAWRFAAGKVMPGLLRRRSEEKKLFLSEYAP